MKTEKWKITKTTKNKKTAEMRSFFCSKRCWYSASPLRCSMSLSPPEV
ncbi:MAG: hypothetical protein IKK22_04805 [Firmicutes bacterium]|nr:hypothetical protein [Bacillota bacterium]